MRFFALFLRLPPIALATSLNAQSINLQDIGSVAPTLPAATIYVADKIITMDPQNPEAEAVAIAGDKIIAVGSLSTLEQAAQGQPYVVDRRFEDKVLMPGFVEPHVHPFLASLTLTMNVISIEDWDTPTGFSPAVRDADGYARRLKKALEEHDPSQPFLTWGYHHYFHGEISRELLTDLAPDLPVFVWHRSAHEMYLNDAALALVGIDEAFLSTLSEGAQDQSDLARGHFFEQGLFGILGQLSPVLMSEEKILNGMAYAEEFYHKNGITTAAEPGGDLFQGHSGLRQSGLCRGPSEALFHS